MLAETFDDAAADDDDDEDGGGGGGGGGGALPGPSDYAGHNAGHNAGQKKTGAAAAPTAYSNDGVFANLSAKPGVGGEDEVDEKPPVRDRPSRRHAQLS